MAHTASAGSTKNNRDSNAKYLGIKLSDGKRAKTGSIIVRQRGQRIIAGQNVAMGKDHTLFALKDGIVRFSRFYKHCFNRKEQRVRVSVIAA